jgi:hypothetical protein
MKEIDGEVDGERMREKEDEGEREGLKQRDWRERCTRMRETESCREVCMERMREKDETERECEWMRDRTQEKWRMKKKAR